MEITYNTKDEKGNYISSLGVIEDILYKLKELDKELKKERQTKQDILKAWKEDRENLETLLKREIKENRIVKNIIKGSGEDDLKLEIKQLREQLKSEHKK